jgi:hypothetical protein
MVAGDGPLTIIGLNGHNRLNNLRQTIGPKRANYFFFLGYFFFQGVLCVGCRLV